MIKRITVENYMAHKLTTLELAEGVTVLTGPNNAGKSAIVEAIRSIAQNPPYRHAIRHGAKRAVIQVELDSGETIEWNRSEKTAIYKIHKPDSNGEPGSTTTETYAKFGRTPPEDARNLLRLDLVETETGPVDIHIGNQRQPIFLIDHAGSQAASFFAASTEAEYLLKMQQALKRRTDTTRSRRKEVLSDCSRIEKELEPYRLLDNIEPILALAEALYERIKETHGTLPLMEGTLLGVIDATARHRAKVQSSTALKILAPPPKPHDTISLEETTRELEEILQQLDHRNSRGTVLEQLGSAPTLHEVLALEEIASSLSDGSLAHALASLKASALEVTISPPELHEVAAVEATLLSLEATTSKVEAFLAGTEILRRISAPPALPDTVQMDALAMSLTSVTSFLATHLRQMEALRRIEGPPSLHEVRDLEATLRSLEAHVQGQQTTQARGRVLREIQLPPERLDTEPLEALIKALETAERETGASVKNCSALHPLAPAPALHEVAGLETLIESVSQLQARLEQTEARMSLFAGTVPCPVPERLDELASMIGQMAVLSQSLDRTAQLGIDREQAIAGKRHEIEETIREAGVCPLCGHTLDVEHFLRGMHG